MKNISRRTIACVAATGILALCAAAVGAEQYKWPREKKGIKVFSSPEDQIVPTNGTAFFAVTAEVANLRKPQPLTFQWLKNGFPIPGATNGSYVKTNAQLYDVGFYSVTIKRANSSVTVPDPGEDPPGARLFVYTGTNTTVTGPYSPGTGTKSCIGSYLGRVTFANPSGGTWFSRPAGTTQCTITDTTAIGPPYGAKVEGYESFSLWSTCAVNTVTFNTKAPPMYKYQFTTYVTSGSYTSGTQLTLDIQWPP